MQIKEAMNFPVISRTGRTSAELQTIIDTLILSNENGKPYSIEGIQPGKKYNSMQQRIRAQAKKLGYKIVIRFDSVNEVLFFQATGTPTEKITGISADKLSANTSEVTGVKSKTKVSK